MHLHDFVVVGSELAGKALPLLIGHDFLRERLLNAIPTGLGSIPLEGGGVMSEVESKRVDHAVELVSDSTGLELIDDVMVAEVVMLGETALDHVLHKAESLLIEFARAWSWSWCRLVLQSLDLGRKPFVALLLNGVTMSIDRSGFPDCPGDEKDTDDSPGRTSTIDEGVFGQISGKTSTTELEQKREQDPSYGEPDKRGDWNTDDGEDKGDKSWNRSDNYQTSTWKRRPRAVARRATYSRLLKHHRPIV